jgi:hypothetical protein
MMRSMLLDAKDTDAGILTWVVGTAPAVRICTHKCIIEATIPA